MPLSGHEPLLVDPLDNTPDVQSEEHDVFRNMEHRVENLSKIHVRAVLCRAAPIGTPSVILRCR